MEKKITRRAALGRMMAGGAGIVVGTSLVDSCNNSKNAPKTTYSPAPKTSDTIITRTWENTGDTLGVLGLGCMRLPRMTDERNSPIDQDQTNAMVDYAIAHGINYFDTAPAYGPSEEAMGIALSRHDRSSFKLATKLSNFERGGVTADVASCKAMFENSLKLLKTDYVDYYLLHAVGSEGDYTHRFVDNGVLEYLKGLKEAGKIRYIGFSFHGSNDELVKVLDHGEYNWDFVQIQLNYLDWKDMPNGSGKADSQSQYEAIVERNIPVVVMEPVRGGALATVNSGVEEMFAAERPDLSPAGMALSFAATMPGVMVVLSGMSNMDQLTENVNTFTDFVPLTDSQNEMLEKCAELIKSNPLIGCTACAYCMDCPSGVNIPGVFAVYDKTSGELNLPDPDGVIDDEYRRKRKIFLNRYKKTLKKTENASACTQCENCLPKCPQRIRITSRMTQIDELVKKLNEIK